MRVASSKEGDVACQLPAGLGGKKGELDPGQTGGRGQF